MYTSSTILNIAESWVKTAETQNQIFFYSNDILFVCKEMNEIGQNAGIAFLLPHAFAPVTGRSYIVFSF